MLTNVAAGLSRMARNVVLNHPNSFNCQVFRRVEPAPPDPADPPAPPDVGAMDDEDLSDVTYAWLGNGYALPVEPFGPALMMDRGDANNGSTAEFRFLVEPEEEDAGNPEHFTPVKHDILYLLLGAGDAPAKLAFEVVGIETVTNIPPYEARYITNRRDDLHIAAGA